MSAVFVVKGGASPEQRFSCMNEALNAKGARMERGEVATVEAKVGDRTLHFQCGFFIVLGMEWHTLRVFCDRSAALAYRQSLVPRVAENGAYAYLGQIGDTNIAWEML